MNSEQTDMEITSGPTLSTHLPKRARLRLSRPTPMNKLVFGTVLTLGALFFLFFYSFPVVISSPGPTFDVQGKTANGESLITIKGAKSYPSRGKLLMTTVSSLGGPGSNVNGFDLLTSFFQQGTDVNKYEDLYPKELTAKELSRMSSLEMTQSQTAAKTVALSTVGYEVKIRWVVAAIPKGSPAATKLQVGDVIDSLVLPSGKQLEFKDTKSTIFAALAKINPGTNVQLNITRTGKPVTLALTTSKNPQSNGSRLGIYVTPQASFPVEVDFNLSHVGGPSAGTMFALGIVNELTKEDLTGSHTVAGTGTLSIEGQVGPISGIKQKMNAAVRDGAKYFLAPLANCPEVSGNIPAGLQVTAVANFDQALGALEKIRTGQDKKLPACPVK